MKGDELMEDLLQFFCGGEEVGGDVDGGDGYYAGDGDDEAFVAADLYDVAFLVFEDAV